jgi:UMF1 family MFS transporter
MGIFGMVTLVFAAAGSFPGGWADDRFGSKRTIIAGLFGLAAAILTVLSLSRDALFFGLLPVSPAGGAMTSPPELTMIAAAALMGFCAGPVQAASRTLMLRLTPPGKAAEFFGLFAFSGKATAFLAPYIIGAATALSRETRVSLLVILLYMGMGGALLLKVREPR